jgi:VanZ family protein
MAIFGVFGAQSLIILIVAVIGLVPVVLYYEKTPTWFVAAYGFLFVAAFATNFENALLPNVLNLTEHFVGNLGAGLAFAGAAYTYRKREIEGDGPATGTEA